MMSLRRIAVEMLRQGHSPADVARHFRRELRLRYESAQRYAEVAQRILQGQPAYPPGGQRKRLVVELGECINVNGAVYKLVGFSPFGEPVFELQSKN